MEIKTIYHGERTYNEEEVITFSKGLLGLENCKRFILFPLEENDNFSVLHSIEEIDMGWIVVSPFQVKEDYSIELPQSLQQRLEIGSEEEVALLSTVTLSSDITKITANLRAPLVININRRIGEQIIVDKEEYLIKHPIFKEE